uniref:Ovule protein n=1 Tax=Hymenolepis diminuta TaxID=6216 RepID=A0A0R3SZ28_HYMDI
LVQQKNMRSANQLHGGSTSSANLETNVTMTRKKLNLNLRKVFSLKLYYRPINL